VGTEVPSVGQYLPAVQRVEAEAPAGQKVPAGHITAVAAAAVVPPAQ